MSNGLFDPELLSTLKYYGTIALDLTGSTIGGFLLGRVFDGIAHTEPWGMLVGPALGMLSGYVAVYRLVMQEVRKKKAPGR